MRLTISDAENGYVIDENGYKQWVFRTLDDVLSHLLWHFEARREYYHGSNYGKVTIQRGEIQQQ